MRTVCFHGRRAQGRGGDFLLAARVLGAAAGRGGLSAQVRTPMWPAAPGSPDRAIVRLDTAELRDLDVPRRYDLEVVCDPLLAVIPPMGGALLPGGALLVNAPRPPPAPEGGPPVRSADLAALAARRAGSLPLALAGAAWAALGSLAPELGLSPAGLGPGAEEVLGRPLEPAEGALLLEAFEIIG